MAQVSARGNAAVLALVLLCVLLHGEFAESAVYTVGGRGGWSQSSGDWASGRRFRTGDVLVFKYDPSAHNVVVATDAVYRSCNVTERSKVYDSGNDRVKLTRGANYFICGILDHCQDGMKMMMTAV